MKKTSFSVGLAIGLAICAGLLNGTMSSQTSGDVIPVDSDDLAGRVTGPSGPESGRRVRCLGPGIRPGRFAKISGDPRHEPESDRCEGELAGGSGAVLSGRAM